MICRKQTRYLLSLTLAVASVGAADAEERKRPSDHIHTTAAQYKLFSEAVNYRHTLIRLMWMYDAVDELHISDAQLEELQELDIDDVTEVKKKNGLYSKNPYKLSPVAYRAYLKNLSKLCGQCWKESDSAVERILDDGQLKRMRQIACQYYLKVVPDAEKAFSYLDVELTPETMARLNAALRDAQRRYNVARLALRHKVRLEAIGELVGSEELRRRTGPLLESVPKDEKLEWIREELRTWSAESNSNSRRAR